VTGGPDLVIFGSIGAPGAPILLWALDLHDVSLYGYSGRNSYVLEGLGTIVGGDIAVRNGLVGRPGAMRGHLDFLDQPAGWIPPLYHPLQDQRQQQFRADYSGETGLVPEPATVIGLIAGLSALALKRRKI
jgi:hypothetical protein